MRTQEEAACSHPDLELAASRTAPMAGPLPLAGLVAMVTAEGPHRLFEAWTPDWPALSFPASYWLQQVTCPGWPRRCELAPPAGGRWCQSPGAGRLAGSSGDREPFLQPIQKISERSVLMQNSPKAPGLRTQTKNGRSAVQEGSPWRIPASCGVAKGWLSRPHSWGHLSDTASGGSARRPSVRD